jgi:hypothetical protein
MCGRARVSARSSPSCLQDTRRQARRKIASSKCCGRTGRTYLASQIRQALKDDTRGVRAEDVIADLFMTTRSPVQGYKKMIWTVGALDDGHWNRNPADARELQVADSSARPTRTRRSACSFSMCR